MFISFRYVIFCWLKKFESDDVLFGWNCNVSASVFESVQRSRAVFLGFVVANFRIGWA